MCTVYLGPCLLHLVHLGLASDGSNIRPDKHQAQPAFCQPRQGPMDSRFEQKVRPTTVRSLGADLEAM